MAEFGDLYGDTVDFQSDARINDLYRQQEGMQRATAMAEAKAKMFADDTRYKNSMNPFDHKIVKEYAQKKIYELGSWQRENPNWKIDPQLRAEYQNRVDDIKSNENSIRGMASDNAFKALTGDLQELAKSGKSYNKAAYNKYLEQKKNYEQYGNQNGYDASVKEGYQPFVYVKPKEFIDDLAGDLAKAGDDIKDYNVVKPKNGNIGEWYSEPKPEDVQAAKALKYQQHGDQLRQMAQENNWNEKQLDEYVTSNISRGVKKNYSIGDANAKFENAIRSQELQLHKAKAANELKSNPSYTPFDYVTDPRNTVGQLNGDDIKKVWGDRTVSPVYGNSGAKADLSDFPIDFNGKYIKDKNNVPFFMGKIKLPVSVAEDRGIYSNGIFDTGKITPEYLGIARLQKGTDKDGKENEYVEVDYNLPINPHDKVARDKFNVFVLPDKLVAEGGNPYQTNSKPTTIVQNGFTYRLNPKTGAYE